jgi:hypothetical protein
MAASTASTSNSASVRTLPPYVVPSSGARGAQRFTNYLRMDDGCQIAYQVISNHIDITASKAVGHRHSSNPLFIIGSSAK